MTFLRMSDLAVMTALMMGYGGSSYASPAPSPSPSSPATTATATIVSGASMMTTTAYSPNPLNILVGTTVMWVNNDNTSHTSTADGGAWSSPTIAPGGQFSFAFGSAGTFSYHCAIHPNMVGTINVQQDVPTLPQAFVLLLALGLTGVAYLRLRRRDRAE
jgi:plastocyanin